YNVTEEGFDLLGNPVTDAFFEEPRYIGNMIHYEPRAYRYNQLKDKTDYMPSCVGCGITIKNEHYNWINSTQETAELININLYPNNAGPLFHSIGSHFTYK